MNNKELSKVIKDSLIEVLDHGVSLASDNEVIQEVPVIKYIASANNIHEIYKARKLKRNVITFLENIKESDIEVELEEENVEEFIDTLSTILIESEKPLKAQIVGSLTRAFAKRVFSFEAYNNFCLIVHSASVPALYNLVLCANDEMLSQIDEFEASHSSAKTDGLAPNIATRIVGVTTGTPLLSSLGVINANGYLNGYGMAIVKYGNLREIVIPRMDIFKGKE